MTTIHPVETHVLDNPAWFSLTGPHASFAEGTDQARRYPADVSPFVAVPPVPTARTWTDLAELVGPGQTVALSGGPELTGSLPEPWRYEMRGEGVQLVSTSRLVSEPAPEAVRLGADDVPEMLDLVARTKPGPFRPRTYQLGTYLGIRHSGALVAMAGERLHPAGYTEISAVCTDPAYRRRGLAARLVRAVAHGIRERGDVPLLHAAGTNTAAIRLYEAMGFELRRRTTFVAVHIPQP
ncbi:GNAT family N-acetyltransferase [Kineosporia succinea]|uniref:Ribosomal protein S18 acetylase RimI-like enzyme n=1 Tax=Kineosporia succinea TaxID=84632 RepID=A0ABT9NWM3_9ACTN|nr:GNAT family N-acetyltransferase [Kineosporia succinea]MDP9824826.1 ribosomal protein S18 acetylase RimI-like enzyme [Kineosporia succinea]